ncbi:MAG: Gfo/Idh/MocA family oxidoreductase, partial [bacterium]
MQKNVVVIGCGYWGKNLVRNFYELGALNGICDSDARTLSAFKEKYSDIQSFSKPEYVFNNDAVRGVAISSPAVSHYDLAKKALLAGKDVFVEKPIALTYKEGGELVKLADSQKNVLQVGHILEYHPAMIKLKEMVKAGELGKIQYIYSNRLYLGKFRIEENILW